MSNENRNNQDFLTSQFTSFISQPFAPHEFASSINHWVESHNIHHASPMLAWWILEHITGLTRETLFTRTSITLSESQKHHLQKTLSEIFKHKKPLQYVLKTISFASLSLEVEPPILIPRPETEHWVTELAAQLEPARNQPLRILDLCTGSGCIALTLAHALSRATVIGTDINPDALSLAKKNAARNNISNATFVLSNVFDALSPDHKFDLIVSNPPYVCPSEWDLLEDHVTLWEDKKALVAPDEGLAILKEIVVKAPTFLRGNPFLQELGVAQLTLEIGHKQAKPVSEIMHSNGYKNICIRQDLAKKDRTVSGQVVHVVQNTSHTQ